MRKKGIPIEVMIVLIAIGVILIFSNKLFVHHEWKDATCIEPRVCLNCDKTEGSPLGHTWVEATCTDPATCTSCGSIEGSALGHSWAEADCLTPKTCSRCHSTEGSSLGHEWTNETHENPSTCKRCGVMIPMARPGKNGQVFIDKNPNKNSKLTIDNTQGSSDTYVKLKNSGMSDIFSFYVYKGTRVVAAVPSGNFTVYFSYGTDWFGPKHGFGNAGRYTKDEDLQDFSKYEISYTLYPVRYGNFSETKIPQSEF
ncbi:MAG: hypothetical protein EOM45_09865 [Clostridia bacterium]|nr:hypothetical protein [Clostridia bacterium]